MNKKGLSSIVGAIVLIAVTIAVSIAVAAWMDYLTIITKEPPTNEREGFNTENLKQLGFTVIQAERVYNSGNSIYLSSAKDFVQLAESLGIKNVFLEQYHVYFANEGILYSYLWW